MEETPLLSAVMRSEDSASTSMLQGLAGTVPFPPSTVLPSAGQPDPNSVMAMPSLIAQQLREIKARAAQTANLHLAGEIGQDGAAAAAATGGYASAVLVGAVDNAEKKRVAGNSTAPARLKISATLAEDPSSASAMLAGQPGSATAAAAAAAAVAAVVANNASGGIKLGYRLDEAVGKGISSTGSHEVRKKNDRDKKRRKRGRIGNLVRQLDDCLQQPASNRQRSVNEVQFLCEQI